MFLRLLEASSTTFGRCFEHAKHFSFAGELHHEDIPEDAEVAVKLIKEPPSPPLNLAQLQAIKAELRALVAGIHEVLLP